MLLIKLFLKIVSLCL